MSVASIKVELAAMRAQALAVWHRLTMAQKRALRRSRSFEDQAVLPKLSFDTHGRTVAALIEHGLAWTRGEMQPTWLTPLGAIVREVGIEQTEREAKSRYSRRKRGPV